MSMENLLFVEKVVIFDAGVEKMRHLFGIRNVRNVL